MTENKANKAAGAKSQKQPLVLNNITIKTINRSTVDIATWRNALGAADRGRRAQLYNLYEDLLLDNVLSDAISKRIEAITNAELVFATRDGKNVPEMDDLIDTMEFEQLLIDMMNAKFWGFSVMELCFADGFSSQLIPRKHIDIRRGEWLVNETDERGTPYRDDDMFLEIIDRQEELGLILKAAPYVIYKRGNFGDWAQYAEIFGMPFQVAKYNNYDEATRIELIRALEQSGSNRTAVIPKESDIEYKDNKSTGDGGLYEKLKTACNEEILIGLLGQTMTTLDGSSRSQGEVHLEVQENKHKADRRFVQRVLNRLLLPRLEKRGYPVKDGYFYFPEAGENISLKDRILIDKELAAMIGVPKKYLHETYGIPVAEQGEEVVRLNPQPAPLPDEEEDDPEPDGQQAAANLVTRLRDFFVGAPGKGAFDGKRRMAAATDDPDDDFDARLIKRVARGEAGYFDAELFGYFSARLRSALDRGFHARGISNDIGIDYGMQSEVARTAMETNLFHFSAAKTLAEVQQLNQLYRESRSFGEFAEKARAVTKVFNEQWLRTEYDTAGAVAENAAAYYRLKGQVAIFPFWEYRTVGDDKVRETHKQLDGVILPADDPRWQRILPPGDWNCRCRIVPKMRHEVTGVDFSAMYKRVDEYLGSKEFSKAKAQGFGINRAELRQVFTANQFYIRKFPDKAARYLDRLGAPDFGLGSAARRKAQAQQSAPRYEGAPQEWFGSREQDGKVVLTDREGRRVILSRRSFDTHTTGSHKDRVQYLDAMREALHDPDEIWINNENPGQPYNNYTMLKYYRDEIVVACCRIVDGKVNELRTWFPLRMKKEVIAKHRRGLLVYKKTTPAEWPAGVE